MVQQRISRRDFAKVVGVGGLAIAAPAVVAGSASRVLADHSDFQTTGRIGANLDGFDSAMHDLMTVRDIPCGALAVVKDGRLVLARGYTHGSQSDMTTQPTSLFRIASLSKAITATAICRLAQDGRLHLNEPVTDILALSPLADESIDPRLEDVTVMHLLQHLGGWDRESPHPDDPIPDVPYDVSYDITYRDRLIHDHYGKDVPLGRQDVTNYGAGRLLHHDPGTVMRYSNYGYWLLGEIVAARSGVGSYDTYVRDEVLAPVDVNSTRPGIVQARTIERQADEVKYFAGYSAPSVFTGTFDDVDAAYGSFNLENRHAVGGWLASAVDYVRFAGIFDGGSILDDSVINLAFAKPENYDGESTWYGYGWNVADNGTTFHSGGLPGTTTIVTRRYDGITWAVLFNKRPKADDDYEYQVIADPLHAAASDVSSWPSVDYFPHYF